MSTAAPSLGGVPPKLATLKVNYLQPRLHYKNKPVIWPTMAQKSIEKTLSNQALAVRSRIPNRLFSLREQSSLDSHLSYKDEQSNNEDTINVLSTTTEASLSSASFTIPRQSTIDADVGFISSPTSFYLQILNSRRANHTK